MWLVITIKLKVILVNLKLFLSVENNYSVRCKTPRNGFLDFERFGKTRKSTFFYRYDLRVLHMNSKFRQQLFVATYKVRAIIRSHRTNKLLKLCCCLCSRNTHIYLIKKSIFSIVTEMKVIKNLLTCFIRMPKVTKNVGKVYVNSGIENWWYRGIAHFKGLSRPFNV